MDMMKFTRRRVLLSAASLAGVGESALAQTPPLRIIVPCSAGGASDLIARKVGERLDTSLGRRVIVDNKPGGGTVIGSQAALAAPADGNTLLLVAASFVIMPQLLAKPGYDPVRDFVPVTLAAANPHLLVASPKVPASNLKEYVAWAKLRKGDASFASFGNGSSGHLGFELLRRQLGIDLMHIPYKGGAPAMQDLLGGQVDTMLTDLPQAVPHVKAGKIKAIAVASTTRSASLPHVPTLAESGLAGFTSASWHAVLARAGTGPPVVQALNEAINAALRDPEVVAALQGAGLDVIGGSSAELAEHLEREAKRYGEAIRVSGAKLD
ncbi:Bug family tripartite tricarboxylate transporter substrate binding protein [Variovorax sp. GB1P17]|uniref:Bug family tripartite tricarboxylate transporter substrate binding protein n=1 Tax=Variovorax sp. GB1P17 TaxID=3443740 RepID=UPI003F44894D